MLGILGGMGPLATADFLSKLIKLTPATRDQEHIPTIVYSLPQIPDRSEAILYGSASPLPQMIEGGCILAAAGARCIAIPCNTAHYWYADLSAQLREPVLHIVDAVVASLHRSGITGGRVGLLASTGTVEALIYQTRLAKHGFDCRPAADQQIVASAIHAVKAGLVTMAESSLAGEVHNLLAEGCQKVILGCTELPLAMQSSPDLSLDCIDSTAALADACLRWFRSTAACKGIPSHLESLRMQ